MPAPASKAGEAQALYAILAVACLLRLFFVLATPFDHRQERFGIVGFNDEASHINYVRHLAEHGSLPVQTRSVQDPDAFVHNDFEYYQPPIYYLSAAPFYRAAESLAPGAGPYAARLLSLLFGVLTVAAAFKAGSAFGPRVGLHCAVLLALFPAHVYFTSLATNDSLAWLVGALFLSRLLHPPAREGRIPESMKLSFLLAAGLLTKSTMLTMAPLLFVRPLLAALSSRRLQPLLSPIGAAAVAFTLASPYYARNLILYGSLLGMESGHGAPDGLWHAFSLQRLYEFVSWTAVTFWNPINVPLGFHHLGMKILLVSITAITMALAMVGWRNILRRGDPLGGGHAVILAAAVLSTAGYVWYNLSFLQSDARLTFQALAAYLALYALAVEGLWRRKKERGTGNTGSPKMVGATGFEPTNSNKTSI